MIRTTIRDISNFRKELSITIPKEDLEPIRERQAKRVQREEQYPGFRKGKTPLGLIKRSFADKIEVYTLEAALDESLHQSILENNLLVVGTPEAKKVDFDENGALVSVVEVETMPEINPRKYKGLEITKDEYEISDSFVDQTIQRYLKEKAELHSVEGAIEKGHLVVMDMQELDAEGKPLPQKKYTDISLRIGDGRFDPELEEQLLGMKECEKKTIVKIYPDDFPQKNMAGKKESYEVQIRSVQYEVLPELNDEFVKELNAEMETVEDLKKATRAQLEKNYQDESEDRFFQDLSQKLVEENPFELPEAIIEHYLDRVVDDIRRRNPKANEEQIRQHYRGEAEFNLKWHYLRSQIAKVEDIRVTEEDEKTFFGELKDDKTREFFRENTQWHERIKEDILERKINDFLKNHSTIKVNKIKL